MNDNWVARKRPALLERRIEFSCYEDLRNFLDRSADLSESRDYYPDMTFSRSHVSITLRPEGESEEIGDDLWEYAGLLDDLVAAPIDSESVNDTKD